MDQKVKELAKKGQSLGIPSFVMMAKSGNLITFHFEKMPINDAMQMMISGFHHVINLELEKHPEYSKEFRQIYLDLAKNFDHLVRETDEKFKSFKKEDR